MPDGLGTSGMSISLPNANETLGLQFSVFGSCSDITPTNNCTVTVAVMNGQTQVTSATAVNNQQNGTYDASFNLPSTTNIQGTGSVVVTCSAMNGNTTNGGLTIGNQGVLTITNPPSAGTEAATGYPSWSAGVVAKGKVVGCEGKHMWLRLTDAGKDIIRAQGWQIGGSSDWEFDLSRVVIAAGLSDSRSRHYKIHVSVWKHDWDGEEVRVSSGFFSVGV